MPRSPHLIGLPVLAALLLALVGVEVLAAMFGGLRPSSILVLSCASPPAMAGLMLLLLGADRRQRDALVRAGGIAFAGGTILGVALDGPALAALPMGFAALVASALVTTGLAARRAAGAERQEAIGRLCAALLLHLSALMMPFFLYQSTQLFPAIVDHRIARFDEAFGVQPSGVVGLMMAHQPILWAACAAAYAALPLAVAAAAVWECDGTRAAGIGVVPGFVLAGFLGYAGYALMPAIGPGAFFGADFPLLHATSAILAQRPPIDTDPAHVRNAMPSLHVTWAALAFLAVRGRGGWRAAALAVFLGLTVLATLGSGHHYLIDLLVAAPLVLAVRAIGAVDLPLRDPARGTALLAAAAMLAAWIVALTAPGFDRFAGLVPLLGPLGLLAAILLERRLAAREGEIAADGQRPGAGPAVNSPAAA